VRFNCNKDCTLHYMLELTKSPDIDDDWLTPSRGNESLNKARPCVCYDNHSEVAAVMIQIPLLVELDQV